MNRSIKLPFVAGAAAVVAAASIAGIASAAGPNLLSNPNFDSGVSNWQANVSPSSTIAWDGPGFAKVTNTSNLNTATHGIASQCVTGIAAGHNYGFHADSYIPSGQGRDGSAGTRVFWYQGAACDGVNISAPQGAVWNFSLDSWKNVGGSFAAPAGAQSAKVMIIASKSAPSGQQNVSAPFVAHFDNVVFQDETVPQGVPLEDTGDKPIGQPKPSDAPPPVIAIPEMPQLPPPPVVTPTPEAPKPTKTVEPSTPKTPFPVAVQETPKPSQPAPSETPEAPAVEQEAPLPPSTGNAIGNPADLGFLRLVVGAMAVILGGAFIAAGISLRRGSR